jgi:hypothetical protein
VRVSVLTADGKLATDSAYRVVIALSSSDTAAHLVGTTSVETNNGVATFPDLTVVRAGTDFRLIARVTGLEDAVSQTFTVTPGPASELRFEPFNQSVILVASEIPVVVRVTDAGGNTIPDATNTVSIGYTRSGPFGVTFAPDGLYGPTGTAAAVNGVATFSGLNFHKSGLYSLSAAASGLSGATSGQLTIQAANMTRLIFVSQPVNGTAGSSLPTFSVQQVDDFGNGLSLPPGPTYDASLSLGNNPGSAALSGTLTRQVFGVAAISFGDITIDKPGTGYTLVVTSAGRSATSVPFDIQ